MAYVMSMWFVFDCISALRRWRYPATGIGGMDDAFWVYNSKKICTIYA